MADFDLLVSHQRLHAARLLPLQIKSESGWQMLRYRSTGGSRKVRVFSERKDPQHTLFVAKLGIVVIHALSEWPP